jgi:hypothetical protein
VRPLDRRHRGADAARVPTRGIPARDHPERFLQAPGLAAEDRSASGCSTGLEQKVRIAHDAEKRYARSTQAAVSWGERRAWAAPIRLDHGAIPGVGLAPNRAMQAGRGRRRLLSAPSPREEGRRWGGGSREGGGLP